MIRSHADHLGVDMGVGRWEKRGGNGVVGVRMLVCERWDILMGDRECLGVLMFASS